MKMLYKKCGLQLQAAAFIVLMLMASVVNISCSNEEPEIQQDFPFEVKVMPVPKDLSNGQTVEIRITIQPSGSYKDTRYYVRYFHFVGAGSLQYYDDPPYIPNDMHPIPKKEFRLYYTSKSDVSQSFEVWISDNFGNEKNLKFQFKSIE